MINIKDAIVEERSLKEYKDVSPDNTGNIIKTCNIPTKYFDHTQNEIRSDEDEYDKNELDEIMEGIDKYLSISTSKSLLDFFKRRLYKLFQIVFTKQ